MKRRNPTRISKRPFRNAVELHEAQPTSLKSFPLLRESHKQMHKSPQQNGKQNTAPILATTDADTWVVTRNAERDWSTASKMLLERNHTDTICLEILAWPRSWTEYLLLLLPEKDLMERSRKSVPYNHCSHDIYSSEVEKAGYEWFKPLLVSITYRNENRKQDNIH